MNSDSTKLLLDIRQYYRNSQLYLVGRFKGLYETIASWA